MSTTATTNHVPRLQIRDSPAEDYRGIYTPEALAVLTFMARFNDEQQRLMTERPQRRATRIREHRPIAFLDPGSRIQGTDIRVQDAREDNDRLRW